MMDENLKRRIFLSRGAGLGLGAMAFQLIENRQLSADTQQPSASKLGKIQNVHHPAKAKNVIFLTQSGGPSQIELFDYKSGLEKWAGKEIPAEIRQGQRLTTMTANQKQLVMPARTSFKKYGDSGATIGEWLPHHAKIADEL
ncbi:DUF1501 domain-containing protein, partial [Pirellulaceae bacterium]|nr:DUF1501 domain-containing protein [Pirellulaceae bacterium]